MNEKKLIEGIRNRDESAAAYAIDRYSRLLWSAAAPVLRNIGTAEDLEECVADAFVYLWEHPEKFDPARGSLKSWLAMIARSRAIDRYRQLMKRQTISMEDVLLQTEMIPDAPGLEEETRTVLMQALEQLTEPDREILLRRYYFDQKPKEIAKATGLTVKQVENRSDKDLDFEEQLKVMQWNTSKEVEPTEDGDVIFLGTSIAAGETGIMTINLSLAYDMQLLETPLKNGDHYYLVLTNNGFLLGQDWHCSVDFSGNRPAGESTAAESGTSGSAELSGSVKAETKIDPAVLQRIPGQLRFYKRRQSTTFISVRWAWVNAALLLLLILNVVFYHCQAVFTYRCNEVAV